ncbi:MAG TPA: thiamine-phosphate kinase [Candidatus Cybelea sp.]|nr:thiamine-phosphate kinase [Candidatus Cybelea sp.]
MTEDELVAAICVILSGTRATQGSIKLGIGDDAALWQPSRSHRSAISSDMLVEGVHFTLAAMSLEDVGWRAMAANVSDLAAMGARPVLATVALGIPSTMEARSVLELYRGLTACAEGSKLTIVGGDLSRAGALTIAVTVVGEVRASNAKLRSGGKAGDVLAVTGPLGAARAGLELSRHPEALGTELEEQALHAFRRSQPRVAEGRFLGASRNVTAMMDCSDGLSTDVHRLAAASGCGAELDDIPVAEAARALAQRHGEDPERFALAGGEDFELLAAVRPRAFRYLAARYAARFGRELLCIGVLRKGSGVKWNGAPLERSGWDHFSD